MSCASRTSELGCFDRVAMVHEPEAFLRSGQPHGSAQRAEDLIDAKRSGVIVQMFEIG